MWCLPGLPGVPSHPCDWAWHLGARREPGMTNDHTLSTRSEEVTRGALSAELFRMNLSLTKRPLQGGDRDGSGSSVSVQLTGKPLKMCRTGWQNLRLSSHRLFRQRHRSCAACACVHPAGRRRQPTSRGRGTALHCLHGLCAHKQVLNLLVLSISYLYELKRFILKK